jgi:hypothetical protein
MSVVARLEPEIAGFIIAGIFGLHTSNLHNTSVDWLGMPILIASCTTLIIILLSIPHYLNF